MMYLGPNNTKITFSSEIAKLTAFARIFSQMCYFGTPDVGCLSSSETQIFGIFQTWPQMTSKGPRNPNQPNRWPENCCYYDIKSKICKKSKKNRQKCQNGNFEAKIKHFPVILSQKDQTLYHFQPYDLVQKSPSQTCRWSTGLVAMRQKKQSKKTPKMMSVSQTYLNYYSSGSNFLSAKCFQTANSHNISLAFLKSAQPEVFRTYIL